MENHDGATILRPEDFWKQDQESRQEGRQEAADDGGTANPDGSDGGRTGDVDAGEVLTLRRSEFAQYLGEAYLQGVESGKRAATAVRASDPQIPLGPDPTWKQLQHVNGDHPCGGLAFCITERPDPARPARLDILRIYEREIRGPHDPPGPYVWRVPIPTDAPTCAVCRRPINPYTNDDVNWKKIYDPYA
jgi:hypothetical protein